MIVLARTAALAAAWMMAATPALAAVLPNGQELGTRRSSTIAGPYIRLPFGSGRTVAPRAGLRLAMVHGYDQAAAVRSNTIEVDAIDLRLAGRGGPALYVGGLALSGKHAVHLQDEEDGGLGLGTVAIVAGVILAGAALGLLLKARSVQDE